MSGWLGLLVVGLTILGPLSGFGKLSNEFRDALEQFPQLAGNSQWQNYKQMSWLIFTVSAAISFSAGYRLWKIHFPESVRFAILALWLAGPLGNVFYIVIAYLIFGDNLGGSVFAEMIGGTIASCVAAGIWTAYLMRSDRVRNTYKLALAAIPSLPMQEETLGGSSLMVGTRKCPFCSESVKEEAIVCKHCGRDLTPIVSRAQSSGQELLSAVANGDLVLFLSLIEEDGVDFNATDSKGRTCLDVARARNDGEMFSLLRKHGGKSSAEINA